MAHRGSMEAVLESLDAFLDPFDEILRAAAATYAKYPIEFKVDHDNRASASNIYSHIVVEADRRFGDRADIKAVEVRGLKVWLVEDFAIRFKKMDGSGRTRSYQTKQQRDFDAQLELPGIPHSATRIAAGYVLDPTGAYLRSQVARPLPRGRISWCAAIVPADEREAGESRWIDVSRQMKLA